MAILDGERLQTDMGWEGEGPFYYTAISEPQISTELTRSANASSDVLSNVRVDSVTFQPCLEEKERSQDRLFAVAVPGVGLLSGIFDGHGGHETADLAVATLPQLLSDAIASSSRSVEAISKALGDAIRALDERINDGIRDLFPRDPEAFATLSDAEVDEIVRKNHDKLLLGMTGSTALITLVDEAKENLWVANLGDCEAVLGTQTSDAAWKAEILTSSHNGQVPSEAERIKAEHPGEPECLTRSRVLGAIAVTRALGDFVFKLPAIYTARAFLSPNAPAFRTHTPVRGVVLPRVLTPPYLNAEADVVHHSLTSNTTAGEKKVLILCSDGLPTLALQANESIWRIPGLSEEEKETAVSRIEREAADHWVKDAGAALALGSHNVALDILRSALSDGGAGGGEGEEETQQRLARMLTVEMNERWMDDTTIQVIHL